MSEANRRASARRRPIPPRLLSREQMADYLQCSPSTIDQLVDDGLIPPAQRWRGLVRWDRVSVDMVIDRVYGLEDNSAEELSIAEAINGRAKGTRAIR
jgi:predicted DNA-binding transcriptional regulator AlpA